MKISRRGFLAGSASVTATLGGAGLGFSAVPSRSPASNRTLVYLFLRGGMDGLNLVMPRTGVHRTEYLNKRPNIAVPISNMHDLNGVFGLHGNCDGLKALYDSGKLAFIHAVGMPEGQASRSHFDSQEMFELGTPGNLATTTGWLARHMNTSPHIASDAVIPSLATTSSSPTSLLGDFRAMSLDDASSFHPNSGRYGDEHVNALGRIYNGTSTLDYAVQNALNMIDLLQQIDITVPSSYPNTGLADDLGLVAGMIKENVGLQVATVDYGGWDTHNGQGNDGGGYFATHVGDLSAAIKAFMDDLESSGLIDNVVLIVQSDFGRRVRENGNEGTDHGTAQPIMVIGGQVLGGQIYGSFPGLRDSDLYLNTDLRMTTDFRQVYCDVVGNFLLNPNLSTVFPGYTGPKSIGLFDTNTIFANGFD
ncbi:DUF1501 domain-containing protein [Thiolapillus sp.]